MPLPHLTQDLTSPSHGLPCSPGQAHCCHLPTGMPASPQSLSTELDRLMGTQGDPATVPLGSLPRSPSVSEGRPELSPRPGRCRTWFLLLFCAHRLRSSLHTSLACPLAVPWAGSRCETCLCSSLFLEGPCSLIPSSVSVRPSLTIQLKTATRARAGLPEFPAPLSTLLFPHNSYHHLTPSRTHTHTYILTHT